MLCQRKWESFLIEEHLLLKFIDLISGRSDLIMRLFERIDHLTVFVNQPLLLLFDMFQLSPCLFLSLLKSSSILLLGCEIAVLLEELKLLDQVSSPLLNMNVLLPQLEEVDFNFVGNDLELLNTIFFIVHRCQGVLPFSNQILELVSKLICE